MKENLFLEMKNYSLSFKGDRFEIDIIPRTAQHRTYELFEDTNSFYILVPFPDNTEDLLKIYYPKSDYFTLLASLHQRILWQLFVLSLIAVVISLAFSLYVLKPLRESLRMLEMFIKDIIHDLNTPLTSILINLKMMDPNSEEVESISQSAKTIAMLHQNLDSYLREVSFEKERFDLKEVIGEQVAFFQPMYDYLSWDVKVDSLILHSSPHAVARIIYNLLSNACKYNTAQGRIIIRTEGNSLHISNDSHGIKSPSRIFERFYKEHDRGLGIGLHIVDKLTKELGITKKVTVDDSNLVTVTLSFVK